MDIHASWHQPVPLREQGEGYMLDFDRLPDEPSVYVFGRDWGDNSYPLYIGQTENLLRRMTQHLDSRRFMRKLRSAPNGGRFLLWCTFQLRQAQRIRRVLDITERGLIDKALADGHELINKRGVLTPTHSVSFRGNETSRKIIGLEMRVRKHWSEFR